MRMSVDMEKNYGGYEMDEYTVSVARRGGDVTIRFRNIGTDFKDQKGGDLVIPAKVAGLLSHALALASAVEKDGLDDAIAFTVTG